MNEEYNKIRLAVDGVIMRADAICHDLDPNDEYDGVLRMIVKSSARAELVHRCAMLILEGLSENNGTV